MRIAGSASHAYLHERALLAANASDAAVRQTDAIATAKRSGAIAELCHELGSQVTPVSLPLTMTHVIALEQDASRPGHARREPGGPCRSARWIPNETGNGDAV